MFPISPGELLSEMSDADCTRNFLNVRTGSCGSSLSSKYDGVRVYLPNKTYNVAVRTVRLVELTKLWSSYREEQPMRHCTFEEDGQGRPLESLTCEAPPELPMPGVRVLDFFLPDSVVREDSGSHSITLELSKSSDKPITLGFVVEGDATQLDDYQVEGGDAFGVVIPPGSTSVEIPITIVDDDDPEEVETVTLIPIGFDADEIGVSDTYSLTIVDDDSGPNVVLTPTNVELSENGSATVTITPTVAPLGTLAVSLFALDSGVVGLATSDGPHAVYATAARSTQVRFTESDWSSKTITLSGIGEGSTEIIAVFYGASNYEDISVERIDVSVSAGGASR